jgi:hypothetical protein
MVQITAPPDAERQRLRLALLLTIAPLQGMSLHSVGCSPLNGIIMGRQCW